MRTVHERKITNLAPDKKVGMTLGDVVLFVQDCLRADVPPDTRVEARVGFRAQIQRLDVTVKDGPQ